MAVVVLVALAGLMFFTFNGVFSALTTAFEVETKLLDSELRINETKLNEAVKAVFEKEIAPLKIGNEQNMTEVVELEKP